MADVEEFRDYRLVDKHQTWTPGGPVVSRLPASELDHLEGRASATIGEPSTLALYGFATGTWIAGVVFGGFMSPAIEVGLAPILIVFAGIAQFIGGLYAFRRINSLGGSAFCCFGAYNTVIGFMLLLAHSGTITSGTDYFDLLGFINISFGFIALSFMLAALRRNLVLVGVLFFLMCGYTLVGISLLGAPSTGPLTSMVQNAGGATLMMSAFLAYYLGMALVVNAAWNRRILPIFGDA